MRETLYRYVPDSGIGRAGIFVFVRDRADDAGIALNVLPTADSSSLIERVAALSERLVDQAFLWGFLLISRCRCYVCPDG